MAKTKDEVLAIAELTQDQKERAEAFFQAQERFHKPLTLPADTNQQVKDYLDKMIKAYNKRKEREEKRKQKDIAQNNELQQLRNLIKSGEEFGFTFQDIINSVNDAMRERKNAAIRAKIEELERQLI